MKKQIIVDVRKIVGKMWNEYEGDLSMRQWMNKNKKAVIKCFSDIIDKVELPYDHRKLYTMKDKEITITFEWEEKENIHYWLNEVKENINILDDYIWNNGLTCYVK